MAVIWACGWEVGDIDYYTMLHNPSISGLISLEGSRTLGAGNVVNNGLHLRPGGSGGKFCGFNTGAMIVAPLPATPRWMHFWFKRRSDATGSPQFIPGTSSGAEQCNVLFDITDNKVKIRRSTTVLATSVGTFDPTAGYYVTIEVVVDNAAGLVRVYLNDSGTAFVEVTAVDTQLQSTAEFLGFQWAGGSAVRLFTDDIVITDASTGRLAESYGILGQPVSNQAAAFTPSAGNNWQNARPTSLYGGVNPASVTRYNEATAAGEDLYNIALDSKVDPGGAVAFVATHLLTTSTGTLLGQVSLKSGATTGNTASFGISRGDTYGPRADYWLTDPNTGVAWTPGALVPSNLSVGLKTL